MTTLVVIPVRKDVRTGSQLRYAVRAWVENCPGVEVVLIGGRPPWWRGEHVATEQHDGRDAQWSHNFPAAMRASVWVSQALGSPFFWWAADDIFPLMPVPADPPTWCRPADLDRYLSDWRMTRVTGSYTRAFVEGMRGQQRILRALGVETQHNADLHMPHWVRADRLAELLDLFSARFPNHPAGHWRAVYGGLWPGRIERVEDPKATPGDRPDLTGREWLSTSAASWRRHCGAVLKERFPAPSRFEADGGVL